MPSDSTGLDLVSGQTRVLSVVTNRKASGQLDFYVAGLHVDTHGHGWLEPTGEGFEFGARLKEDGVPASTARIRSSTEATHGELGRFSVHADGEEVELAVTHGSSAVTTDPLPTDADQHRSELRLPGDPGERNDYRLMWSTTGPSGAEGSVAAQLFGGKHPVWLEVRPSSSSTTLPDSLD